MLQLGWTLEGKRDTPFRERDDLRVGVARGGPALYVERVGPPAVAFAVM